MRASPILLLDPTTLTYGIREVRWGIVPVKRFCTVLARAQWVTHCSRAPFRVIG